MPPELPHYRSFTTPFVKFSPPSSPEAYIILPPDRKYIKGNKTMKIPGRKLIPVLVFILSTVSVLRLLRIATSTSYSTTPSPPISPSLRHTCHSPSPECSNASSYEHNSKTIPPDAIILTTKEFKFLSNLIKHKAPCNLLVFGLEPQYLKLSSINTGGISVFLEDNPDKISKIRAKTNSTHIYKVSYQVPGKKAYKLLKHARKNPSCAPNSGKLQSSTCKLALTNLPKEVYKRKWDVVVVDGPSGQSPDAPGRMAAIYTASMVARTGNTTDVVVHDVDRTIEKWFSWEFLCEENLVSSKGKFWNFQIKGKTNSTKFCTD